MLNYILAFALCAVPFFSFSQVNLACKDYSDGVNKVTYNGKITDVIVARSPYQEGDVESLIWAREEAYLLAKSKLAELKGSSTLQGARKIFECTLSQFVVIGLISNDESKHQAESIRDMIWRSIMKFR